MTAPKLEPVPDHPNVEELPRTSEELREDMHDVIARYPNLTICSIVGTLEMIKQDLWEALKASGLETDKPKKT